MAAEFKGATWVVLTTPQVHSGNNPNTNASSLGGGNGNGNALLKLGPFSSTGNSKSPQTSTKSLQSAMGTSLVTRNNNSNNFDSLIINNGGPLSI